MPYKPVDEVDWLEYQLTKLLLFMLCIFSIGKLMQWLGWIT